MNLFNIYIDTLKNNYSNHEGRASRKEYWLFFLANSIVAFIIGLLGGLVGLPIIGRIYALAVMVPGICIGIRRLHDTGRSGYWILLPLTVIGSVVLLVFYCMPSTPGDNAYGSNPYGVDAGSGDPTEIVPDEVVVDATDTKSIIPSEPAGAGNEETIREDSIIPNDAVDDGDEDTYFLEEGDEDTMILEGSADDEETMPLFAFEPPKPKCHLIRSSDDERLDFIGTMFTIGSSESKADYVVTSNKRVSRNHATIYLNDDSFFIKDNSKNGTFVNGEKLEPDQSVALKDGDTIKLADEAFTVLIEEPEDK